MLVRVEVPVDPDLEAAAVVRRVYRAGGPALLFVRPVGCRFPLVGNLFGTMERARYIFRDTLDQVRRLVELRAHLGAALRQPWRYAGIPRTLWHCLPRRVSPRRAPVLACRVGLEELPFLRTWPGDGGAYITLPLVYSEDPEHPGWLRSNLGMYRVQLSGGLYQPGEEVGLHYQIHRGIGAHHAAALRQGRPLRISVCVGGPPALTVAAAIPLPEGLPEVALAGALGGAVWPWRGRTRPFWRRPTSAWWGRSSPGGCCPKGPSGTIWATTVWFTTFR
jgi:4-hydroxy-3-polyprenylbenzoate decarboxylase